MQVGGLDLIFHHELHHVVENSILGSGLHIRNNPMYLVLNELRTEQNAKKTTEQFDKIFSKEIYKQDYKNVYEALFPLADDFLLWYKNILNQCAITQDITKLEEIFGKEDVRDYGQNLLTVHNVFKKYMKKELSPSYKISGQPFIEFQEKLRENAESNGIKIFQKTL